MIDAGLLSVELGRIFRESRFQAPVFMLSLD